jgi:hypothetical protein
MLSFLLQLNYQTETTNGSGDLAVDVSCPPHNLPVRLKSSTFQDSSRIVTSKLNSASAFGTYQEVNNYEPLGQQKVLQHYGIKVCFL